MLRKTSNGGGVKNETFFKDKQKKRAWLQTIVFNALKSSYEFLVFSFEFKRLLRPMASQ
jgi:hypothetical protein